MMLALHPWAARWQDSAADRFAPVLDQVPEGLGLIDNGKLIYANPPFLAAVDCDRLDELLGRVLPSVLPNFDCGVPAEKRLLPHVCPNKPLCEFDRVRPDGSVLRLEASCTPFPWEGRDLRIVTVRDVSERERRRALHESMSRLRSIFRSIPIGIVECSSDGSIVESNPAVEQLFGYSHDELRGLRLHEFIRGDAADRFLRLFDQSGDIQLETYQAEHRYVNRRNAEGWIRLTACLVERIRNEPSLLIGIVEEVTEYKRAERQLRDAQKMEVIGRLVGGVAHDFNNLLTGIMLYCDLLAGGLKDEKMRQHAEEIRMAGEQGAALVQQLLAINRQHVVEPRILCLNTKVGDTRDLLSRLIGENIELCTELEPSLGNVLMDPTQFQQILLNLVLNARDAMPGGGRILILTANRDLQPAGPAVPAGPLPGVMLAVVDQGCGMNAETLSHLFEPFFTTKTAGRGNGLGLATLHDIVEAAGGSIEVESQLGTGTTFRIILPRVPDRAKSEIPEFSYAPQAANETILIVEDNVTVRQAVRGVLRECGYSVLEAGTGAEALAIADRHEGPIDLLLADLSLPGLSGQTVARRLRATRSTLKCLYMSGYESRQVPRKIESEAVVFFQKPFTGAVLLQKVREILEARPPASIKNQGGKNHDDR